MFETLGFTASLVLVELSQKRFAERDRAFDNLLGKSPNTWGKGGRYGTESNQSRIVRKTAAGRNIRSGVFRS